MEGAITDVQMPKVNSSVLKVIFSVMHLRAKFRGLNWNPGKDGKSGSAPQRRFQFSTQIGFAPIGTVPLVILCMVRSNMR